MDVNEAKTGFERFIDWLNERRICGIPIRPRRQGNLLWQQNAELARKSRNTRNQLGLARTENNAPWANVSQKEGHGQSWIVTSSSHMSSGVQGTAVLTEEQWRLSFAWEFISQSEGLSLRILCTRPGAALPGQCISNTSSTNDDERSELSEETESEGEETLTRAALAYEWWSLPELNADTAAAIYCAMTHMLLPELLGAERTLEELDDAAKDDPAEADPDSRLLCAQLHRDGDQLRATQLRLATRDRAYVLQPKRIQEEQSAKKEEAGATDLFDGMAFEPYLRSRPEVRDLTAVMVLSVQGAIYLRDADQNLAIVLAGCWPDAEQRHTLKRLILPWCCGTDLSEEALEKLAWGFTFGWPETPDGLLPLAGCARA